LKQKHWLTKKIDALSVSQNKGNTNLGQTKTETPEKKLSTSERLDDKKRSRRSEAYRLLR
jgi:hypothetical protein